MMGESHIVDKKLKKSMQLLEKYLEKKDCETFLSGEPLSLIINHELYVLHKLDDSTVEIKQEGRAKPGYIRQGTLPNLYDSVVAFITNVEYAGVDWGCGSMSLKLPDAMPPPNLSFITYLITSADYIWRSTKNGFLPTLIVIGQMAIFPFYIGRFLGEAAESTLGFIGACMVATVMCTVLSLFLTSVPMANGAPSIILGEFFIYLILYLIGLGYIGAFYGRYQGWKAKWEVKQE